MDAELDRIQAGLDGDVRVRYDGDDIAIIEMDCGDNRINKMMVQRLNAALDQVERNPKVKALVTTGAGKFYSNGFDLKWIGAYVGRYGREKFDKEERIRTHKLTLRLLTFPMPTVAAINGHCFAAGGILTLAHDVRIMRTGRGWWCMNEVFNGIKFHPLSLELMRLKLPSGPAFHEVVAMGQRYSAQSAHKRGVVDIICDEKELMTKAIETARKLGVANYDRGHLGTNKDNIYSPVIAKLGAKL